jgi:hypothetical protein
VSVDWRHFALEESGDRRLTEWMRANLRIAVWVCPADAPLEKIHAAVLQTLMPPLCLLDITTPWTNRSKPREPSSPGRTRRGSRGWLRRRGEAPER